MADLPLIRLDHLGGQPIEVENWRMIQRWMAEIKDEIQDIEDDIEGILPDMGVDAVTFDGLTSGQFIRSDVDDGVSANTTWGDSYKIKLGNGGDLEFYHTGSYGALDNTLGEFYIVNTAIGNNIVFKCTDNGSVERGLLTLDPDANDGMLRFLDDNFEMTEYSGSTYLLNMGGDFYIENRVNGSNIYMKADNAGGTPVQAFKFDPDGNINGVWWLCDDRLTISCGTHQYIQGMVGHFYIKNLAHGYNIHIQGENASGTPVYFMEFDPDAGTAGYAKFPADNLVITFGASADAYIVHNGTNTFFANNTGTFYLSNASPGSLIVLRPTDSGSTVRDLLSLDANNLTIGGSLAAVRRAGLFIGRDTGSHSHSGGDIEIEFTSVLWKDSNVFTHSTSTDPEDITVVKGGYFRVTYNISYENTGYANRTVHRGYITLNGSRVAHTTSYCYIRYSTTYGRHGTLHANQIIWIDNNDVVGLKCDMYDGDGGSFGESQDVDTIANECWITMERVL